MPSKFILTLNNLVSNPKIGVAPFINEDDKLVSMFSNENPRDTQLNYTHFIQVSNKSFVYFPSRDIYFTDSLSLFLNSIKLFHRTWIYSFVIVLRRQYGSFRNFNCRLNIYIFPSWNWSFANLVYSPAGWEVSSVSGILTVNKKFNIKWIFSI